MSPAMPSISASFVASVTEATSFAHRGDVARLPAARVLPAVHRERLAIVAVVAADHLIDPADLVLHAHGALLAAGGRTLVVVLAPLERRVEAGDDARDAVGQHVHHRSARVALAQPAGLGLHE